MKILIYILIVSVMEACCESNDNVHLLKNLLHRLQRGVTQKNSNTTNKDDCKEASTKQLKYVNKLINQSIDPDSNDDEEIEDASIHKRKIFHKISKKKDMIRRSVEYENHFDHNDYDDNGEYTFHTGDENILFPIDIKLKTDDENIESKGKMPRNIDTDQSTKITSLEDYILSDENDSDTPSSISTDSNSENSTGEDSSEDSTIDDSNKIVSNDDSENSNNNASKDNSDVDNEDSSKKDSKDSSNDDGEDSRNDESEDIIHNDSIEVTTNGYSTDSDNDDTTELHPSQPKSKADDDWEGNVSSSEVEITSQDSQNKVTGNISLKNASSTSIANSTMVNSIDTSDILQEDDDDFTTELYTSDILHNVSSESSSDESPTVTKAMLVLNQGNDGTEPHKLVHKDKVDSRKFLQNSGTDPKIFMHSNGINPNKPMLNNETDPHKSMNSNITDPYEFQHNKESNQHIVVNSNNTEPNKFENISETNPNKSIHRNSTDSHNINDIHGNSLINMNDLKYSEPPLPQDVGNLRDFIIMERGKLEDLLELNGTSKNIFITQKIEQHLTDLFEIALINFNQSLRLLKNDLYLSLKYIFYTPNIEYNIIAGEKLGIDVPKILIADFLKYNEGLNDGKKKDESQNINNKNRSIFPHDLIKDFGSSGTAQEAKALGNNAIRDNNPNKTDYESKPMDIQFLKSYLEHKEDRHATKTGNESEQLPLGRFSPQSYLENEADIHPNNTVYESQPMNTVFPNTHLENEAALHPNKIGNESAHALELFQNTYQEDGEYIYNNKSGYESAQMNSMFPNTYLEDEANIQHNKTAYESERTNSIFPNTSVENVANIHHNKADYESEPMNSMFPNDYIEDEADQNPNKADYESEPTNSMFINDYLEDKADPNPKKADYESEPMNSMFPNDYLEDEANIQLNKTAYKSERTNSIFPNTSLENVANIHHNKGGYESEPIESSFQKPYLENKAEKHSYKTGNGSESMDSFITKSYFENREYKSPNKTGHESEPTDSFFKKSYPGNKTYIYPNKTDYEPEPIGGSIMKSYLENNTDIHASKIGDESVQLGKFFLKSSLKDVTYIHPNKTGNESEPLGKLFSKSYLENGVDSQSSRTFNKLEPMGRVFPKFYTEDEGSGKQNRSMTLHVGNITDIIIIANDESKFKIKKDTDMSRLIIEMVRADVNDKEERKNINNETTKLNLEIYKEKQNYGNITYNNVDIRTKEASLDKGLLARDNNSGTYSVESQTTREDNSRISLGENHLTTIDNSRVSLDEMKIARDDHAEISLDDSQISKDNYSAIPLIDNQISRDRNSDISLDKDQRARDDNSNNFNANTNWNIETVQEIPHKLNEVLNQDHIYTEKPDQKIDNDLPNSLTDILNQDQLLMTKKHQKLDNNVLIQDQNSTDKIQEKLYNAEHQGQIRNKSGLIGINQNQTSRDSIHQKHENDVPQSMTHILHQDKIPIDKIQQKPGNEVHQSLADVLNRGQRYTDKIDQKQNPDVSTLLTSPRPMILNEEEMVLNITKNINEPENINVVTQKIISEENKDGLCIGNMTRVVNLLQELVESQNLTNSQMEELQLEHKESLIESRHTNEILHNIININSLMEANGHLVMLPRAEHGVPMNWSMSVKRCASHSIVPFIPKTHHDLSWLFHLCESIWDEGIWIPATYSSHLRQILWLDGNDASEVLGKFLNKSNIPVDLDYRGKHVDTKVTTENTDITDDTTYDTNPTTETNTIEIDTTQQQFTSVEVTSPSEDDTEDYCLTIVIGKDLSRKIEFNQCGEELWPMVCIL